MEIIYHKCEFVGEMQSISQLQQKLVLEDYPKITETLLQCVRAEQLPRDLDTARSAVVFRAYVTGIIENWLFSPTSFNMTEQAPMLVQSMIDLLQYSPTLRTTSHSV